MYAAFAVAAMDALSDHHRDEQTEKALAAPSVQYAVLTAAAKMPASCWGSYGRVAVVRLDGTVEPSKIKMISERARGVAEIIETWESRHIGRTSRCAFQRAIAEAHTLAKKLNSAQ